MSPKPRASIKQEPTGKVRTGVLIPAALEHNLRLFCLNKGISRQDAITLALRELMKKEGMDPDRFPKIEYKY
jgi:hypothetical protein